MLFEGTAWAQAAAGTPAADNPSFVQQLMTGPGPIMALVVAVMYFLVFRPQNKKAQEATQNGGAVKPASELPPAKDKPVHEIRYGRIKAVIWQQHTESGTRHNVQLKRIFKRDDSSQWEQSDSLGRDDCLLGAEILRQAALWIFENSH